MGSAIVGNGSAAQKRAVSSTDEQLPPTIRWTARRKAEVLAAVRSGKITMEETMRRYQLKHRKRAANRSRHLSMTKSSLPNIPGQENGRGGAGQAGQSAGAEA